MHHLLIIDFFTKLLLENPDGPMPSNLLYLVFQ